MALLGSTMALLGSTMARLGSRMNGSRHDTRSEAGHEGAMDFSPDGSEAGHEGAMDFSPDGSEGAMKFSPLAMEFYPLELPDTCRRI